MRIDATTAQHGPKGSAAGFSTDPSEGLEVAVTIAFKGICQAATSIILTEGRGPVALPFRLPGSPKRLP